jgi:SAM-dependent methyltransferase
MPIRASLYLLYSKLQQMLVPGLRNSQWVYKESLQSHVSPAVCWLDLGCGHQLLPEWMPFWEREQSTMLQQPRIVVGIDADYHGLCKHAGLKRKVVGDIQRLPFRDASFDLVTANVVVEHVSNPAALLEEVYRVLKPAGRFLFHTPNFWSYGTLLAAIIPNRLKIRLAGLLLARREEDIFPTFYRMNTLRALNTLAQRYGFVISQLKLTESSAQTIMLGPVVALELLLIRALRAGVLEKFRTNIIAVFQKRPALERNDRESAAQRTHAYQDARACVTGQSRCDQERS